MKPLIFVASNCPACDFLKKTLDRARIPYRILNYDSVRAIELGVRSVPAVFVGDVRVQAPTPAKIKAAMRRKG